MTRLTTEKVRQIHDLLRMGSGVRSLARSMNISPAMVSRIKNGSRWPRLYKELYGSYSDAYVAERKRWASMRKRPLSYVEMCALVEEKQ